MEKFTRILNSIYRFSSSWTGAIIIVLFVIFFIVQGFVIPSRSMVGTLYEGDLLFVKKYSYGIPIPRLPWVNTPIFPDFKGNGHLIEGERPKRGEIVVFLPPHMEKTYFVKRLFAVGGDEVIFTKDGLYLHFKEGNDYINEHYADLEQIKSNGKLFVLEPFMQEYAGINTNEGMSAFEAMKLRLIQSAFNPELKVAMEPIVGNNEIIGFYKKIEEDEFFMIGDNRNNSEDSRFWGSVPYKNIVGTPWVTYFSLNLEGSIEADIPNNPHELYNIRWERVFKTADSLNNLARQKEKN